MIAAINTPVHSAPGPDVPLWFAAGLVVVSLVLLVFLAWCALPRRPDDNDRSVAEYRRNLDAMRPDPKDHP